MSRIAKKPLKIAPGVTVTKNGDSLAVKGPKGEFTLGIHRSIDVVIDNDTVKMSYHKDDNGENKAILGTTIVLLGNMVKGVKEGFERKLLLVGVGYRAKAQGNKIELSLGFSHPVVYDVPQGITVETPSNTEIILRGIDKEKIGQVAAEIRAIRPPESYKCKGVRYAEEKLIQKETKKK